MAQGRRRTKAVKKKPAPKKASGAAKKKKPSAPRPAKKARAERAPQKKAGKKPGKKLGKKPSPPRIQKPRVPFRPKRAASPEAQAAAMVDLLGRSEKLAAAFQRAVMAFPPPLPKKEKAKAKKRKRAPIPKGKVPKGKVRNKRGQLVDKARHNAGKKGWRTRMARERQEDINETCRLRLKIAEYEGRFEQEAYRMAEENGVEAREIYTFFLSPNASDFQCAMP